MTEEEINKKVAELAGYNYIIPVLDMLYGAEPGSPALKRIPQFTREDWEAEKVCKAYCDSLGFVGADDGSWAGSFTKGSYTAEVTSVSQSMMFCEAMIRLDELQHEAPPKTKKKHASED